MKNWQKVKLGSLLTESKNVSEYPNTENRIRVKLNVLGVEKRPNTKDKTGATKYYIRTAGQFVYGKQNLHKGAFGIIPHELDGFESSSDIPAFDVDESCYPEWIFYFFKKGNFYLKLQTLAKGVGSKRINPEQLYELDIFLPTKEEQKKILDEIEKSEVINQNLIKEIKLQEKELEKLRQSVLQDAIHGKLTLEWRNQNKKLENENNGSELFERIKSAKDKLVKEKKIRKEKSSNQIIKDEIPFPIPTSWKWCRMQDISEKLGAGSTPKGGNSVYVSNGIIFLRSQNIYNHGLYLRNVAFIPIEIHDRMHSTKVFAKDILLNITGASIGRSVLIDDDFETANVNQHVAIVRMIDLDIRQYIHKLIISPYFQAKIMEVQVGVSREGLSMTSLKNLLVPLPSIDEQNAILEKVNNLEASCDEMQKAIISNKEHSKELIHSVLIKLLGDENNVIVIKNSKKTIDSPKREIKYESKTTLMELVELLNIHGQLHAEDLWKMSKFPEDIDKFYAELKSQIEQKKTIKESVEKGYLELS